MSFDKTKKLDQEFKETINNMIGDLKEKYTEFLEETKFGCSKAKLRIINRRVGLTLNKTIDLDKERGQETIRNHLEKELEKIELIQRKINDLKIASLDFDDDIVLDMRRIYLNYGYLVNSRMKRFDLTREYDSICPRQHRARHPLDSTLLVINELRANIAHRKAETLIYNYHIQKSRNNRRPIKEVTIKLRNYIERAKKLIDSLAQLAQELDGLDNSNRNDYALSSDELFNSLKKKYQSLVDLQYSSFYLIEELNILSRQKAELTDILATHFTRPIKWTDSTWSVADWNEKEESENFRNYSSEELQTMLTDATEGMVFSDDDNGSELDNIIKYEETTSYPWIYNTTWRELIESDSIYNGYLSFSDYGVTNVMMDLLHKENKLLDGIRSFMFDEHQLTKQSKDYDNIDTFFYVNYRTQSQFYFRFNDYDYMSKAKNMNQIKNADCITASTCRKRIKELEIIEKMLDVDNVDFKAIELLIDHLYLFESTNYYWQAFYDGIVVNKIANIYNLIQLSPFKSSSWMHQLKRKIIKFFLVDYHRRGNDEMPATIKNTKKLLNEAQSEFVKVKLIVKNNEYRYSRRFKLDFPTKEDEDPLTRSIIDVYNNTSNDIFTLLFMEQFVRSLTTETIYKIESVPTGIQITPDDLSEPASTTR